MFMMGIRTLHHLFPRESALLLKADVQYAEVYPPGDVRPKLPLGGIKSYRFKSAVIPAPCCLFAWNESHDRHLNVSLDGYDYGIRVVSRVKSRPF